MATNRTVAATVQQRPDRLMQAAVVGVVVSLCATALLATTLTVGLLAGSAGTRPVDGPAAAGRLHDKAALAGLPVSFELNAGQTDPSVRFLAHVPGGMAFFTPSEVVFSLGGLPTGTSAPDRAAGGRPIASRQAPRTATAPSVLSLHFVGANRTPVLSPGAELPGKVNYLQGNDPAVWHTDVRTYAGITYQGLYPGIDLGYGSAHGALKGTYTVAPGADASGIRWVYDGAQALRVDGQGNLRVVVNRPAGAGGPALPVTVTEHAPVAWQEIDGTRRAVAARYQLGGDGSVAFTVANYDRGLPLTIDPSLSYSTYLGGSGHVDTYNEVPHGTGDYPHDMAVDHDGNTYVTGSAASPDFPITPNAYNGSRCISGQCSSAADCAIPGQCFNDELFVTKLDPTGSALVYSTYIAGDVNPDAYIAVDGAQNVYLAGTAAPGVQQLPTTPNAYQKTFPVNTDPYFCTFNGSTYTCGFGPQPSAFLTKLNATGSSLLYSTYFNSPSGPGAGGSLGYGVAVDSAGNAYLIGSGGLLGIDFGEPDHFPVTARFGSVDAPSFIAKFNPNDSGAASLVYSVLIGGHSGDEVFDVAVDAAGDAYIVGGTNSTDFPTQNAVQATCPSLVRPLYAPCAFVTELNASGTALVHSTYLGGSDGSTYGLGITVDGASDAYVVGVTRARNGFPTTAGAFETANPAPADAQYSEAGFATKFSATGTLVYSTYLDPGTGSIAVDSAGKAYVTGAIANGRLPTKYAVQCGYAGGGGDAVVLVLNATGTDLVFSSYLGGSGYDGAYAVGLDGAGGVYLTGITTSIDFPVTPGAYQTVAKNAFSEVFITKIVGIGDGVPYGGAAVVQATGPSGPTFNNFLSYFIHIGVDNCVTSNRVSSPSVSVPGVLSADVLHAATTIGPSRADSEASVGDLSLTVAGQVITAHGVGSSAHAGCANASPVLTGTSTIAALSVDGLPVPVLGLPNQTVPLPGGGTVVINEQVETANDLTVNALHVTVPGQADVALASSFAGITPPCPPSPPGAPTNVTARAGNATAAVAWVPPAVNGGSPVTSYIVTPSPACASCTGTTTDGSAATTTVRGLVNGTPYSFTVAAANEAGSGPASAPSPAVTPAGPPDAPTNLKATPGNASAALSWSAPGSDEGSAITSYTVTPSPACGSCAGTTSTGTGTTVTGLANGTTYTFTVTATNAVGTGPASAPSNAVTPAAPPSAPTGVSAAAGDSAASISWSAPPSDGGSAITAYTVTPSPACGSCTGTTTNGPTTTTVGGLTNGTTYTFTVTATNAAGTGPASAPSNAVTPRASLRTTAAALTSSANPSALGEAVAYTATVSPAPDGGTVGFSDGGATLSGCGAQPVDVSSGRATCAVTTSRGGSHSITATYSGDAGYGASTASMTQTVTPATTTTSVTSSADPSLTGQAVTYTATVSPIPDGGTVAFSDGGATIGGCGAQPVDTGSGRATCAVTYSSVGSHTITATYGGDASYSTSTSPTLTQKVNPAVTGAAYFPLASPQRLEDTRSDGRTLAAGGTIDIQVAGGSTGVPTSATAVVLNVTSVNNAAAGYLQVYPHGGSTGASAVNSYYPNQLTQDLVTVPIDATTGAITILSSQHDDVVVDEFGYYAAEPSGSTAGQYMALPPQRICDTRNATNVGCAGATTQQSGGVLHLQVTGNGGVPASGVAAVILNVTVADDTRPGFVQAYAHGTPRPMTPQTSNVNFNGAATGFAGDPCPGNAAGSPAGCQVIANRVIVPVDASGGVDLYTNQGPADLIVDVNGYFTDATASTGHFFTPTTVTRLHDTRVSGGPIAAHGTLTLPIAGAASSNLIPAGATSAVLTITIDKTAPDTSSRPYDTGPSAGFLTVYPGPAYTTYPGFADAGIRPLVSDLNFGSDSIVPAQVYATLGPNGSINIYNGSSNPIDVVVDVYGYFGG